MRATALDTRIGVRDAATSDVAAVAAIYGYHVVHGLASFEEDPADEAEIARRRAAVLAAGLPYLVATIGPEVSGFAYAAPFRHRSAYRYTVEDSIYLAPEATGRGLGRLLLGELIERCTALDLRQMVAMIGDSRNAASIRLHASMGFRHAGTLLASGFKLGRWADTVIMQRPLGVGEASLPPSGDIAEKKGPRRARPESREETPTKGMRHWRARRTTSLPQRTYGIFDRSNQQ